MKTTIEIDDALLAEAKVLCVRERTSLRALVDTGLRTVIEQRRQRFELRDARAGAGGPLHTREWDGETVENAE